MARSRSFQRSGPKRMVQWVGPADQGYVAVASGGATLLASSGFTEKQTVVRVRGNVSVKATTVTADLDIVGAFGMGIVSTEAFTAGIVSIPEPFNDADWGGWFVWRSFNYHLEFISGVGTQFPDWNFEVDSKAMRIAGPNEMLVLVAESQGGAYSIAASVRTLIKLN